MQALNATRFFLPAVIAGVISMAAGGAESGGPAAPAKSPATLPAGDSAGFSAEQLARAQAKLAHAVRIADQFAPSAAAAGLPERWRFELVNSLMRGPESRFDQIQGTDNARDALQAAASLGAAGDAAGPSGDSADQVQPESLGDIGEDLTYIPLPSPCRIADTRSGGGALAAGVARTLNFTNANSSQGGVGCTPFAGYVGGGVPGAAAVNITVIGGSGAVSGSYLQAYAAGGSTSTSWLNFSAGQVIANQGVLPISTGFQFVLLASAPANAIVDVFGSFVRPQATALDCTTVTNTDSFLGIVAATCSAGYALTGGGCRSNSIYDHPYQAYPNSATSYSCGFYPEIGQSIGSTLTAYARCCRTPGRVDLAF